MMTPGQLFTEAQAIVDAGYASVEQCDRHAFALALFFQGYSAGQACHKAFVELEDTDGALQMLARHREALATVAAANDEGVADYPDELLDRVAEAITRAQCPGREGPYGGYDYGHRHEDDLPRDGRYVVRDFRDVTSEAFGAWVHQTPDVAVHEAAFDRLTKRHIARAALDAAARLATSRSQHEGASS